MARGTAGAGDRGGERAGCRGEEDSRGAGGGARTWKVEVAFLRAPLCPAGHLPHKGGDWQLGRRASSCNVQNWRKPARHLISPLVGEMSGRTEGGAVERRP
ncbi:hypothetical protein FJ419_12115 [Mesorhizobium sp. B2-6-2]|nr:hypothetical protein FJ419_12115 [Mesorhizobium sp. B2-6-2]